MKNKNKTIELQTELSNCNAVKALLMLLIVLYHSMVMYVGEGMWSPVPRAAEAPIIGGIAEWLNSFHIYAFTLISGYIFYYIRYEKGGYQKYLPFLYNKALRLIVPYVCILITWVLPIYIYFYGTKGILEKFILGVSPNQLWFLLMLFWVFAIFWWISDLANKKPFVGAVLVGALYVAGMVAPNILCFYRGLQYILYFYIGFLIRKWSLGNKMLYKIPSVVYLCIDLLLYIIYTHIRGCGLVYVIASIVLTVLVHAIGAISAFVLLQRFVNRFLIENRAINFFSKHSMTIFLIHQQLIYFSILLFNGSVPPILLALINFVFSLTFSLLISLMMSKSKFTRMMVGLK